MKKIRLESKSNVLDRVDLGLTPYLTDPISLIGLNQVNIIGIIAPTQSGKTLFLQTAVSDSIQQDPGSLLYILPDEFTADKAIDEKIISMINASPELAKYKTAYSRDMSKRSVTLKHMTIRTGWAGSVPTINMLPMKHVIWDEVRLMDLTMGNESNAIKQGQDRLTTFLDYGLGQGYMVSSPSTLGDLLYQQLTVPGTLYVGYQVQCAHCREYAQLDFFKNVKYRGKVECLCLNCGRPYNMDYKKRPLHINAKYAQIIVGERSFTPTYIKPTGEREKPFNYIDYKRVFFHWSSLESPFRSIEQIYDEFIKTKDKLFDYKNTVNCWFADFWIDDISKTTISLLTNRENTLNKLDIPPWTKVIKAGVDTQDPGFNVCVRAFGAEGRSALIDNYFIDCPMETTTCRDIEDRLNTIFEKIYFQVDNNQRWQVAMCALDSGGHRTKEVYQAAESLPRLYLVKGAHDTQMTTILYNEGLNLYLVRTTEYLKETEALAEQQRFELYSGVDAEYKSQFCAMRKELINNKKSGTEIVNWKKMGKCDYRLAEVHAFICLDIPTSRGTSRINVNSKDFIWNPILEQTLQYQTKEQENEEIEVSGLKNDSDIGWSFNTTHWFK